jgi:hypothetical protein
MGRPATKQEADPWICPIRAGVLAGSGESSLLVIPGSTLSLILVTGSENNEEGRGHPSVPCVGSIKWHLHSFRQFHSSRGQEFHLGCSGNVICRWEIADRARGHIFLNRHRQQFPAAELKMSVLDVLRGKEWPGGDRAGSSHMPTEPR